MDFEFGLRIEPLTGNPESQIQNPLGGFDNLTRFQAAGAYANALRASADERANALQVWIKAAVGAVVGMAHSVTELGPLAANLAAFRHCYVPPMRISL